MRFEELLAHQGPLVHVDHSFRRPRQRSAPTSAIAEPSTSWFNQWLHKKPELPDDRWLTWIGFPEPPNETEEQKRQRAENNSSARLWGHTEHTLPETAPRYKGKPKYATEADRALIIKEIKERSSLPNIYNELIGFANRLRWLQNLPSDENDPLDVAEKESWEELEMLFKTAAESIKADKIFANYSVQFANAKAKFESSKARKDQILKEKEDCNKTLQDMLKDPKYVTTRREAAESERAAVEAHKAWLLKVATADAKKNELDAAEKLIDEQQKKSKQLQGRWEAVVQENGANDNAVKTLEKKSDELTKQKESFRYQRAQRESLFLTNRGLSVKDAA